jgi:hypothetical protein
MECMHASDIPKTGWRDTPVRSGAIARHGKCYQ